MGWSTIGAVGLLNWLQFNGHAYYSKVDDTKYNILLKLLVPTIFPLHRVQFAVSENNTDQFQTKSSENILDFVKCLRGFRDKVTTGR
jgi:hypothetical protein